MDEFTEEHSKLLLAKEWLSKVDGSTSTPYLLKYHFTSDESTCLFMITDTKKVWAEVVSSKVLARRWRNLNADATEYSEISIEENAWRKRVFELLSDAHTMGGVMDLDFEVVDSDYSDFSLRMEGETFKWKWETCFLGYQRSSEIISQHLIFPLISVTHLSFSSAKPFSDLSDTELEKSIDRIGRTAKRTPDTHVKNTIAKPVIATSIRRMSAIYHSASDLTSVTSTAEKPLLQMPEPRKVTSTPGPSSIQRRESPKRPARAKTPELVTEPEQAKKPEASREPSPKPVNKPAPQPPREGSETETDSDDDFLMLQAGPSKQPAPASMQVDSPPARSPPAAQPTPSPAPPKPADSDSDAPPARQPAKKKQRVSSDDDDDDSSADDEKSKRSASGAPRGGGAGIKRGARQPIKRGGKRF